MIWRRMSGTLHLVEKWVVKAEVCSCTDLTVLGTYYLVKINGKPMKVKFDDEQDACKYAEVVVQLQGEGNGSSPSNRDDSLDAARYANYPRKGR